MISCVIILITALYISQSDAIQRPTFIDRLNHLINKRSTEASTCLTNAFNDYKQAVQRALLKHNTDIQTELQKHNTHQRELRRYNHALKQALQKYNTTIDACNTPPPPTTAVACINSGACTRDADCCDRRCTTIDPSPPIPPAGSYYICGPPRIPCDGNSYCVCGAPDSR
ncbi:unnamed protein product [Adineta steineri]|uniref:Uncharacterized protein n=1 Tax=Adineta steineri TaxID=433720 RepID=A0A814YAA5_9BILA|nr:unnamed protein product [Adineta steineri]CAF1516673.1 unnamed protein product [Adineta steineri]